MNNATYENTPFEVSDLDMNELDQISGGVLPLMMVAAYAFMAGATLAVASYAATHQH